MVNRIAPVAVAVLILLVAPAALASYTTETRGKNYTGGTGDFLDNCNYPSTTCFYLGTNRDVTEVTISIRDNWVERVAGRYEITAKEICTYGCGYGGAETVVISSGIFCDTVTVAPPTTGYYGYRKDVSVSVFTGLSHLFCGGLNGEEAGPGLAGRVRVDFTYWENPLGNW